MWSTKSCVLHLSRSFLSVQISQKERLLPCDSHQMLQNYVFPCKMLLFVRWKAVTNICSMGLSVYTYIYLYEYRYILISICVYTYKYRHIEYMSSQHRFTQIYLSNLYNEMTSLVDAGRTVDIGYLDLRKAFETVSPVMSGKLMNYGQDKNTVKQTENCLNCQAERLVINSTKSTHQWYYPRD